MGVINCYGSEKEVNFFEQQNEILRSNKKENVNIIVNNLIYDEKLNDTNRFYENNRSDLSIKVVNTNNPTYDYNTSRLNDLSLRSNLLSLKILNPDRKNFNISELNINTLGLISSHRPEKDGFVYFGYKPEYKESEDFDDIDVNLPLNLSLNKIDEKSIGRHFQIEFRIDKNRFCIKDLGIGYGTFARLDFPLILKNNHLIHIGESYIVVNMIDGTNQTLNSFDSFNNHKAQSNIQLKLKLFGVNNKGDSFVFNSSQSKITIGRIQNCDINIVDKLLSKYHCRICFDEKDGWTLLDGKDTVCPSTNGTWLFTNDDFEIYDKLVFKSNQTVFQVI